MDTFRIGLIYFTGIIYNVSGLIIFDIIYKPPDKLYGKAVISIYLKSMDAFYFVYGDITECDFRFGPNHPHRFCDLMTYSQICITKQELLGKRIPENYAGVDKKTFSVNNLKVVTDIPENRVDLICSIISIVSYEQSNSEYFPMDHLHFMSKIEAPYSDIFTFTCYAGDDYFTGRGYEEEYGIYNVYVKSGYTELQYSINFQVFTYIDIFKSKMFEEYIIKAKCSLGFYGKTCWYTCDDTVRMNCNCVFQDIYINVPCQSVCVEGWLKKYTHYLFSDYTEIILSCDVMDLCKNKNSGITIDCPISKVCLPVDNKTYYCEDIRSSMYTYDYKGNLSTQVFIYNEIIYVDLDRDVLLHTDVGVNTTASLNTTEFPFISLILKYRFDVLIPSFRVSKDGIIDKVLNFTVEFNFKAWEYFIKRIKIFRIYKRPEYVMIYKYSNFTPITLYLLIGDIITGISTSLPKYRTVWSWVSEEMPLDFPLGEKIEIPTTSNLGIIRIVVTCTLIIQSRDSLFQNNSFSLFVKIFDYLRWNDTKNLVRSDFVSQCQTRTNIYYKLEIYQLSHEYDVKVFSDYISAAGIPGGLYSFICYFKTQIGLLYSAYLNFKLQVLADKICIFLFANIRGSIIQCGHNGYSPDEYSVTVSFYIWYGNEFQLMVDGDDYIRIPYKINETTYKYACVVRHLFIHTPLLRFEDRNILFSDSRRRYPFTKPNKLCLKYQEYIEIPLASDFANNQVNLEHKIYELTTYKEKLGIFILIPILYLIWILMSFIIVTSFLFKIFSKQSLITKENLKKLKRLKLCHINIRLNEESRRSLLLPKKEMQKLFSPKFLSFSQKQD